MSVTLDLSEIKRSYDRRLVSRSDQPLRLHLNEHTGGCSPAVIEAIRAVGRDEIALYPDYGPITRACEGHFGVPPGWLTITNGLDEGLHAAAYAVARATRRDALPAAAVFVEPAFEMYGLCADAAGLAVRRVLPLGDDPAFPVEAFLAALTPDVRLVYLTDPNNPTGLAVPAGLIERASVMAPQALVLVDEAYGEFSGRTAIGLLDRYPNLVVGRTFAKAYGLAGLRIGAVLAHPDTLAPLRQVLPPFPLNVCAVRALDAALADRDYLAWSVAQSAESRALIGETCRRLNVAFWPSEANFVMMRVGPEAPRIAQRMAAEGVLVRDRSAQPGCAGCIRITAGVVAHTRRAMTVLESVLA